MPVDPNSVVPGAFREKPPMATQAVPLRLDAQTTVAVPQFGTPEWYASIQAPEPDGTSRDVPFPDRLIITRGGRASSLMQNADESVETPRKRVVISYGPREGKIVVGVEVAPEWDIEASCVVDADALRQLLPIIREIVKVKNLIGADFYVEQPAPHSNGVADVAATSGEVGRQRDAVGNTPSPAKRRRRAG